MNAYSPAGRTLWNLKGSGQSTTLTAGGNSGAIDITDVTDILLTVYVAGTSSGTNPTLDAQIDIQDKDGNWIPQVAKITQLTSGPNYATVSCGLHIAGNGSMVLPRTCRVAWTVGGTVGPTFPQTSISLIGR